MKKLTISHIMLVGFYVSTVRTYSSKSLWLKSLPQLVKHYSQKWDLINLKPFKASSFSYVLEAYQTSSKSKVILKFSSSKLEAKLEGEALKFYNGEGCVHLLNTDIDNGVLLRSYANPPSLNSFFPHKDEVAVLHAIKVIQKLHSKKLQKSNIFPTTQDWLSSLESHNLIPPKHIAKAKLLASNLLDSQTQTVLLHGDLHHDNILNNQRNEGIAIDPKGVIGDPAYEIGAFLRNPINQIIQTQNTFSEIIPRRIKIFSEHLNIDPKRIQEWAYVQSVLAACWAVEDNDAWEKWIHYAELINNCCLENKITSSWADVITHVPYVKDDKSLNSSKQVTIDHVSSENLPLTGLTEETDNAS